MTVNSQQYFKQMFAFVLVSQSHEWLPSAVCLTSAIWLRWHLLFTIKKKSTVIKSKSFWVKETRLHSTSVKEYGFGGLSERVLKPSNAIYQLYDLYFFLLLWASVSSSQNKNNTIYYYPRQAPLPLILHLKHGHNNHPYLAEFGVNQSEKMCECWVQFLVYINTQ